MSQYAQFFSWVGQAEWTVEWAERAHELDPLFFVPVAVRAYGLREKHATPNVLWRPTLDPYRDDPCFQALLEELNLPYEGA